MDIKEIVSAGGSVEFSYKEDHLEEWVGTAKIYKVSPVFGLDPKIVVQIPTVDLIAGGRKEYKLEQLDEAVSDFKRIVFRPENLMYKMPEAIDELYSEGHTELDLDIDEELELVRTRRAKLISGTD